MTRDFSRARAFVRCPGGNLAAVDVAQWCTQSRVWVVAGKGGVGKSTVAATLAAMAARSGLAVVLVELEGRRSVPAAFGHQGTLGYEPVVLLRPDATAATAPDEAPDGVGGVAGAPAPALATTGVDEALAAAGASDGWEAVRSG